MVVMQAIRSCSRRIAALFGAGALVLGRLWFLAIEERTLWARWPLVPLAMGASWLLAIAVWEAWMSARLTTLLGENLCCS